MATAAQYKSSLFFRSDAYTLGSTSAGGSDGGPWDVAAATTGGSLISTSSSSSPLPPSLLPLPEEFEATAEAGARLGLQSGLTLGLGGCGRVVPGMAASSATSRNFSKYHSEGLRFIRPRGPPPAAGEGSPAAAG